MFKFVNGPQLVVMPWPLGNQVFSPLRLAESNSQKGSFQIHESENMSLVESRGGIGVRESAFTVLPGEGQGQEPSPVASLLRAHSGSQWAALVLSLRSPTCVVW